jgi:membrane-associated phospholipid phosphatase
MARLPLMVWIAIAGIAIGDLAMAAERGWTLANWWRLALPCAILACVILAYSISGRSPKIAALGNCLLLWSVFAVASAVLAYFAAALRAGPLYDHAFAAADARLGFDWTAWFNFVDRQSAFKLVLTLAYGSFMPQIVLTAIYFSYRAMDDRNYELLANSVLGLLITVAVFSFLPALGPCRVPEAYDQYLPVLTGLRSGEFTSVDLSAIKGIVCFPSYHTVIGVLCSYAHRQSRLFLPVAGLNAVMLVSIPSEGGHYLIDVVAGVVVAMLSIGAIRRVQAERVDLLRSRPSWTG